MSTNFTRSKIKMALMLSFSLALSSQLAHADLKIEQAASAVPFGTKADAVLVDLINPGLPACSAALIDATHSVTSLQCTNLKGHDSKNLRVVARSGINREHVIKKVYALKETGLALIELSTPIDVQPISIAAATASTMAWLAIPESSVTGTHFVPLTDLQVEKNTLHYKIPADVVATQGTPIVSTDGQLIGIHTGVNESLATGQQVVEVLPFIKSSAQPSCGDTPGAKCVDWQNFFTANDTDNADKKFTLVSTEEFKRSSTLAAPKFAEKRTSDPGGPKIKVITPNLGGDNSAPVDVVIQFDALTDAEIVPSSFKSKYGMFGVDITDRLLKHAELGKNTLVAKHADIPKGDHRIDLEIMDSKGRLGLLTLNFTVK